MLKLPRRFGSSARRAPAAQAGLAPRTAAPGGTAGARRGSATARPPPLPPGRCSPRRAPRIFSPRSVRKPSYKEKIMDATANGSAPPVDRRAWLGLAVLALPTLLTTLDLSVLFLALPQLAADFGASATQQLWISDGYGFLIAGFLVTMGPWATGSAGGACCCTARPGSRSCRWSRRTRRAPKC
jgi:hypothetical protein